MSPAPPLKRQTYYDVRIENNAFGVGFDTRRPIQIKVAGMIQGPDDSNVLFETRWCSTRAGLRKAFGERIECFNQKVALALLSKFEEAMRKCTLR